MSLKIFHIADVHIGKKYSRYPEEISEALVEARFQSLKNAIEEANKRDCDFFVIAGDLFESLKVSKKDIDNVTDIINDFQGSGLLILPGNNDYYEETLTFWDRFEARKGDHVVVLKETEKCVFESAEWTMAVFPAPCDAKHSPENRIGWIRKEELSEKEINVLIAHGALRDISPDLGNVYFPMEIRELDSLGMDLNLLGHTHVPYPFSEKTSDNRIFNSGTTEPDGMDYRHDGSGWYIEVDAKRKITAERIPLGSYRFIDEVVELSDIFEPEEILKRYEKYDSSRLLLRLKFLGYIDKDLYDARNIIFNKMKEHFFYFWPDDQDLKVKFKKEMVGEEFPEGSLPFVFLNDLLAKTDEDTAHLAYELLMEVRKND